MSSDKKKTKSDISRKDVKQKLEEIMKEKQTLIPNGIQPFVNAFAEFDRK